MKTTNLLPLILVVTLLSTLSAGANATEPAETSVNKEPLRAGGLVFSLSGGIGGQYVRDQGTNPDPGPGVTFSALYTVFPWLGVGLSGGTSFLASDNLDIMLLNVSVEARAYYQLTPGLLGSGILQLGYVRYEVSSGGYSDYSDGYQLGIGFEIMKEVYSRLYVGVVGTYQIPRWNEDCIDMGGTVGVRCNRFDAHGWYGGISLTYFLPLSKN